MKQQRDPHKMLKQGFEEHGSVEAKVNMGLKDESLGHRLQV